MGGEEYDDSDMYMEPDEAETTQQPESPDGNTEKSYQAEEVSTDKTSTDESEVTTARSEIAKPGDASASADQVARNSHHSARYVDGDDEARSLETESQNFFPSFAELFANHRLPFAEQRYRPNRFLNYFQRERNYQTAATGTKDQLHSLLGSGNFGVIPGGTYYPENKENDEYSVDESLYNPYYRSRAHYYRNPKPQPVRGGDFFANFRDFADITAPPKSSFSHLSVVYANKNGSATGRVTEPRNIIETLKMLEEEETNAEATPETPQKKLSKGKRKLMKMKQYEEDKARRSRMSVEPLLALS